MAEFGDVRVRLLDALKAVSAEAERHGAAALRDAMAEEARRFEAEELSVVVCGEFKTGKSSLLNALLASDRLLPVDIDIATATVIVLRNGPKVRVTVLPAGSAAGEAPAPFEIPSGELARYAVAGAIGAGEVSPRSIVVEVPNPYLANGIMLVDTPGISGLDRTHSEATFAALADADIVLFVSDVKRPLTTAELDFLANRLLPLNRKWLFVQTKCDEVLDAAKITAENLSKIEAVVGTSGALPPVIPVSSRDKIRFEASRDEQDLEDSGFRKLDRAIWSLLAGEGAKRQIERARQAVVDAADTLAAPLDNERAALESKGPDAIAKLKAELTEADERFQALQSSEAGWRRDLTHGLADIKRTALDLGFAEQAARLQVGLDQPPSEPMAEDPSALGRRLYDDLCHLHVRTCQTIAAEVRVLREKVARESGLPLKAHVDNAVVVPLREAPEIKEITKPGMSAQLVEVGGQLQRQVVGLSIMGYVVGAAVGGAAGALFGGVGFLPGMQYGGMLGTNAGLVPAMFGARDAWRKTDRKFSDQARREVVADLKPYLAVSIPKLRGALYEVMTQIERPLVLEFSTRIKAERAELQKRRQAIEAALKVSRDEALARIEELREQLFLLDRIKARALAATFGPVGAPAAAV